MRNGVMPHLFLNTTDKKYIPFAEKLKQSALKNSMYEYYIFIIYFFLTLNF